MFSNEKNNNQLEIRNNYNLNKNLRNYGIDLLRIFATINIIVLHINKASKELNYDYSSPRFYFIWLSETLAYWGVNGFGIISGIVGYKKYRFSNVIFIWFQTLFYSTTISLYNYIKNIYSKKQFYLSFFPIYRKYHWYVNAYVCMYPFLPFINYGINNIKRISFRNIIIILICFFSIYDMLVKIIINKNNYNYLNNGYSPLWLIILYIIGGYIGKYIISTSNKIINHIFWLLIYLFSSFFSYYIFLTLFKRKSKINYQLFICYISPTILIQAFSLVLIFSGLNLKNYYILKKLISFLTPLTINIIIISSSLLSKKYTLTVKFINYFKELAPYFLIFKTYGFALIIYLFCGIIDYFRFLLFKKVKVKELCLFLESKFPKLLEKIANLINNNNYNLK